MCATLVWAFQRNAHTLFCKTMASQRIQFPASEVLVVERRTGFTGWLRPGFNVILRNGIKLYLTDAEKEELDKAVEKHTQMMAVAAIISNAQANRPKG